MMTEKEIIDNFVKADEAYLQARRVLENHFYSLMKKAIENDDIGSIEHIVRHCPRQNEVYEDMMYMRREYYVKKKNGQTSPYS